MSTKKSTSILVLLIIFLLVACAQTAPEPLPPVKAVYATNGGLAGQLWKQLTIYDAATWQPYRTTKLLFAEIGHIDLDPQGRLWIGYTGGFDGYDARVQIIDAGGEVLKTMDTCRDLEPGTAFSNGYAFVGCTENGFSGKVVVVDLNTLEIVKTIDIEGNDNNGYLLQAIAADASFVAVIVNASDESLSSDVVIIDSKTLEISRVIDGLVGVLSEDMVASDGRLIIANGWSAAVPEAGDIIVFDIAHDAEPQRYTVAPSPLWIEVVDDIVYSYHDSFLGALGISSSRQLSQLDLNSGEILVWDFPDLWRSDGIAMLDDNIVLTHVTLDEGDQDGIYLFDFETGELALMAPIEGAYRIASGMQP